MVLPTKGNLPLQNRAGYNQGPQPSFSLANTKFIGQPAIKAKGNDTVIFRNSPVVPGENNPRALGMNPGFISGVIFNLTGDDIEADLFLVDDKGNEFNLTVGSYGTIVTDDKRDIYAPRVFSDFDFDGLIALLPGWSLLLRVTSGSPTAGQGLVIWPWVHNLTRNVMPIVAEVTTSLTEIGPPKGRGWQLMGGKASASQEQMAYLNFDSVPRTVAAEYLHLAGEDILISSGISVTPRDADLDSGIERAFDNATDDWGTKSLILAYPDKIKVKAGENQTSAPLYLVATFSEFDLPRDMG
jgi:hypothetical protein